MRYLLDTNICIAILKEREPGLVRRLQTTPREDLLLCSVVKAELLYGARKSQRVDANLSVLAAFFQRFDSLPVDDHAAEQYGVIRTAVERSGSPVGANDLLIGSVALAHDLVLVTRNTAEFARVPGLRLEEW